jgi:hypothetical protein
MAKYVCVCMVCMSALCIDEQMDSPIGLPKLANLSAHGFTLKFWVTIIDRYEGRDDIGSVITPFLPTGFSRVSARKSRQPEPSRPDPTRARHTE